MSELEIIGAPRSNFVWVTRIAMEEKGVPIASSRPCGARGSGARVAGQNRRSSVPARYAGPATQARASWPPAARMEQWVSIIMTHVDPVLMRRYAGAYYFSGTMRASDAA